MSGIKQPAKNLPALAAFNEAPTPPASREMPHHETTRQLPAQGVRDTPYEPSSPRLSQVTLWSTERRRSAGSRCGARQWPSSVQARQWRWTLPKAQHNLICSRAYLYRNTCEHEYRMEPSPLGGATMPFPHRCGDSDDIVTCAACAVWYAFRGRFRCVPPCVPTLASACR